MFVIPAGAQRLLSSCSDSEQCPCQTDLDSPLQRLHRGIRKQKNKKRRLSCGEELCRFELCESRLSVRTRAIVSPICFSQFILQLVSSSSSCGSVLQSAGQRSRQKNCKGFVIAFFFSFFFRLWYEITAPESISLSLSLSQSWTIFCFFFGSSSPDLWELKLGILCCLMCRFVLEDCVDLRAAVGFTICRTKGVVRRIAKSRHRFLLLGFGTRSVRLSLSLFRSVSVSLFLTELRRFLFLFWFSKSRSLERTGTEAWNSLLLDDVHRITEKDFHQKISTCVLLQNSITKLFAHRQRGGGQTLVERAKEKEWRQHVRHVRQQRPWLEEEEEVLNCFWRKRQRQEEEGRGSNSKWWWELQQQRWRTHASLCCEHYQRKLLPSLDAVSIPISLSLSLSPWLSANTSCSHQNNCHWQLHRMELWNSLHSYYYTGWFIFRTLQDATHFVFLSFQ